MSNSTELQILLIALFAVANLPVLVHLLKHRRTQVPILPQFQSAIDELNAAASNITQVVSSLKNQVADSPAPQDIADTLSAVQASADAVKAAVSQ